MRKTKEIHNNENENNNMSNGQRLSKRKTIKMWLLLKLLCLLALLNVSCGKYLTNTG